LVEDNFHSIKLQAKLLDSLSFLISTSNFIEQPKKREDVSRRKEVKEVETQAQTLLTLGLDQIIKFLYRLDRPLGGGSI
jgi:hypothetical protein